MKMADNRLVTMVDATRMAVTVIADACFKA